MRHSLSMALLIASVFWTIAGVIAVAQDSVLSRPVTTQTAEAEPAVDPEVSSAQNGFEEPRAQQRDDGGGIDERTPADVQAARAMPGVATWQPHREAGAGVTSRERSSLDGSPDAPGSQSQLESLPETPTNSTERALEPVVVKADPPGPTADPPAVKADPPGPKADPPAAEADPPGPKADPPGPKADPPGPKADPPGPKADPPGPKADPPGPKADPPGPKADPPGPKADPPGPKADPPAAEADPPGPKADPPGPKADPPGPKADPPGPKADPPGPKAK